MGKWEDIGNLDGDVWRGGITPMAGRVRAAVGVTHNLGDYNGVRIDFAFEDDVAEGESIEEAAARLFKLAESSVEAKLEEYA